MITEMFDISPSTPFIPVDMTRRYPKLSGKVLKRDSEIVKKLLKAWDDEKNKEKVLQIFLKEQTNLSDERYWELMRTVWVISGSVETADVFRKLMNSPRKERYYFSTPEEAKRLREMTSLFSVFRATDQEQDGGLSWTISEEYAEKYQKMFNRKMILHKVVNKSEVFALIERNKEEEIIIL